MVSWYDSVVDIVKENEREDRRARYKETGQAITSRPRGPRVHTGPLHSLRAAKAPGKKNEEVDTVTTTMPTALSPAPTGDFSLLVFRNELEEFAGTCPWCFRPLSSLVPEVCACTRCEGCGEVTCICNSCDYRIQSVFVACYCDPGGTSSWCECQRCSPSCEDVGDSETCIACSGGLPVVPADPHVGQERIHMDCEKCGDDCWCGQCRVMRFDDYTGGSDVCGAWLPCGCGNCEREGRPESDCPSPGLCTERHRPGL